MEVIKAPISYIVIAQIQHGASCLEETLWAGTWGDSWSGPGHVVTATTSEIFVAFDEFTYFFLPTFDRWETEAKK